MSRNICISVNRNLFRPLNGFSSIDIDNTDSIIDYSADVIVVDNLQTSQKPDTTQYIIKLLSKLRVGGQIVLRFLDPKLLSKQYSENLISDAEFKTLTSNMNYYCTLEGINEYLDQNFTIDRIDQENYNTTIKIIRVNIT
jgi:hypothetical protein